MKFKKLDPNERKIALFTILGFVGLIAFGAVVTIYWMGVK